MMKMVAEQKIAEVLVQPEGAGSHGPNFTPTARLQAPLVDWSRTYQGKEIRFAPYSTGAVSDHDPPIDRKDFPEGGPPDSEGRLVHSQKGRDEADEDYADSDLTIGDSSDSGGSGYADVVASGEDSDFNIQSASEPASDSESGLDTESESESESEPKEDHTPLTYQIPEDVLREALTKSASSGAAYWSHHLYKSPDSKGITVHYCKSKQQSENVLPLFKDSPVLGFDIEWNPRATSASSIRDNASLIQLADESRIALFQIALFKGEKVEELLPTELKAIMENPEIIKVGVGISADCTRLKKFLGIDAKGLIELSHIHNLVTHSGTSPHRISKRLVSLARQVESHLLLPLSKGEVRESDWHKELKYDQVSYAASDAYAGFRLFDVLESKRKKMGSRPPRPAFAELKLPISPGNVKKLLKAEKEKTEVEEDEDSGSDAYETAQEELPGEDDEDPEEGLAPLQNITSLRLSESEQGKPAEESEQPPASGPVLTNPQIDEAAAWAKKYLASDMEGKPHKMEAGQIAALLRNPPLKEATVSNYILDATSWENLPFDPERAKVLLGKLPASVVELRYWSILNRLRRRQQT